MNQRADNGINGFVLGLVTGGAIGAALAIALVPKVASELRQRVRASAGDLREVAARSYEETSGRIADAIDGVAARGQAARDGVADAVGRGAREVEAYAMASKAGRS